MNEKVINAMFNNICDKNEIRPVMNGIHFDEKKNCCYASDGHLLVIYHESDPYFAGKTMSPTGEVIDGCYPNVYAVFPDIEKSEHKVCELDVIQLQKACQWHARNIDSNEHDAVIIEGVGFNIKLLNKLLTTIETVERQPKLKFIIFDSSRPVVIKSKKMDSIIMPALYDEANIDLKRGEYGDVMYYSYENFINDYVFNSWRKPEVKKPLDWLKH